MGTGPAETSAVFSASGIVGRRGYKLIEKYGCTTADRTVSMVRAARAGGGEAERVDGRYVIGEFACTMSSITNNYREEIYGTLRSSAAGSSPQNARRGERERYRTCARLSASP